MVLSDPITLSCYDEIGITYYNGRLVNSSYPLCANPNAAIDDPIIVHVDVVSGKAEQIGASLQLDVGMEFLVALIIHLIGVEEDLALTPREGHRLRQVSFEKQIERGFKHPGSTRLTSNR